MHSTCSQNRIDVEKRTNNQHNAHTQPYSAHTLTRARARIHTDKEHNKQFVFGNIGQRRRAFKLKQACLIYQGAQSGGRTANLQLNLSNIRH